MVTDTESWHPELLVTVTEYSVVCPGVSTIMASVAPVLHR